MSKYYKTLANGTRVPLEKGGMVDNIIVLTANTTLRVEDSGNTFHVATDALVITLPATIKGLEYIIANSGADGNNIITLAPNASDKFLGKANDYMTGTDDKDLIHIKATAKRGDYIHIIGDGVDGWFIESHEGIWSEEDQTPSPQVVSDNLTVKAGDSGKVYTQGTDAKVFTLPLISTANIGMEFTFINVGADGNNLITLAPDVLDSFNGQIANAAADVTASGTINKDWVNTKATANKGDYCTVKALALTEWYIIAGIGIWASEA